MYGNESVIAELIAQGLAYGAGFGITICLTVKIVFWGFAQLVALIPKG